MRDYEKVEVVKEQLKSITCNKCGRTKELKGDEDQRGWDAEEFQFLSFHFGYGSGFDGENWDFDICEDCLADFIETFKHVPDGYGEYTRKNLNLFDKFKGDGEMVVYIVYRKGFREDTWGYPQGQGSEIIEEIISIRVSEDAAKEEIRNMSDRNLSYMKKTVI